MAGAAAKAIQRERLTTLKAPVAGTVQQLAAHTEGGVVTEAQPIMVIVPEDANVTAEVTLENKDIGFVNDDGGAGTDFLDGGDGGDTLVDGETMVGGAGNDTYVLGTWQALHPALPAGFDLASLGDWTRW